jgi:uncharacterized protein (TIRG00374 family)
VDPPSGDRARGARRGPSVGRQPEARRALDPALTRRLRIKPIKKTLRHIAIFVVIVGVLYLLLPRLVDTEKTLALLTHASYVLLAGAVALECLALLSYANLTRYILKVLDIRLRLRDVLAITLSSLAVSHVLSAGGVGGWVVTYNALRKRGAPHGLIFVAIAAQQFFNYVVLWFVFALALVYLIVARGESIAGYLVGIVFIGLILWLTGYGVYLYNHRSRMRRRVTQLAHLANRVMRREVVHDRHIDGWLDNLFAGMRRMTSHGGAYRTTTVLACGYWTFDMLCLFTTFWAFDYHIGFGYLAVGYVVAYAIGTLAPTPGGLGAVEGILIAVYVSFGVPSATAVAVVLVYRLINFWLPIPPGFVAYLVVKPGRQPIAEGEVELAAAEVCALPPLPVSPTEPASPADRA